MRARADALVQMNRPDDAQVACEELLRRDPDNAEVLANLSGLAGQRGDHRVARQFLLRALKAAPKRKEFVQRLLVAELQLLEIKELPEALTERGQLFLELLDRLLSDAPESAATYQAVCC